MSKQREDNQTVVNGNGDGVVPWRFNFLWLSLTGGNLLVCGAVAITGIFLLDLTATGEVKVFEAYSLDPWLWLAASLLTATIISFYNKVKT